MKNEGLQCNYIVYIALVCINMWNMVEIKKMAKKAIQPHEINIRDDTT